LRNDANSYTAALFAAAAAARLTAGLFAAAARLTAGLFAFAFAAGASAALAAVSLFLFARSRVSRSANQRRVKIFFRIRQIAFFNSSLLSAFFLDDDDITVWLSDDLAWWKGSSLYDRWSNFGHNDNLRRL